MPEHLNSRIVLIVILAWPCLYREAEGSAQIPAGETHPVISNLIVLFYFSSQGTSSPVSLKKGALTTHCVHTVVLASSKDFVNICFTSYYNIDIFSFFLNNGILDQPYVSLFNFVLILNVCKKIIKLFMFQLIRTMVYFAFCLCSNDAATK